MATLIERACAYLDKAEPQAAPWKASGAQIWLNGNSQAAMGVKACHVIDVPNSVMLDEMRKVAREAQDAVIATVQAHIRDGDMEAAIRKLAETHNVHIEGWSDRYFATV